MAIEDDIRDFRRRLGAQDATVRLMMRKQEPAVTYSEIKLASTGFQTSPPNNYHPNDDSDSIPPTAAYEWQWDSDDAERPNSTGVIINPSDVSSTDTLDRIVMIWDLGVAETFFPIGYDIFGDAEFDLFLHTYPAQGSYLVTLVAITVTQLSDAVTGRITIPHYPADEFVSVSHN